MFSNRLWPYWLASWGSLCILMGIAGCRGMPSAAYTSAMSAPPAPNPVSNEETLATPTVTPTTSPQPTSPTKPIENMTATAIAATAVTATPTPVPPPPYIRISGRGPEDPNILGAEYPAVAYNAKANEYLVVWKDDDTRDGSTQIYGQRLTADGQAIGPDDFRISAMDPTWSTIFSAGEPAVTYNPTRDEYFVVWHGSATADGTSEIYGQRLTADGQAIGPDDFRISTMGPDGDVQYSTWNPAVAYNPTVDEYLAVWHGADTTPEEYEIYGQRLTAQGEEIGSDDFRISVTGGYDPAISYNSTTDEYLVIWEGRHPTKDGRQVYGQRVTTDGQTSGDIVMYSNGHSARLPVVTYHPTTETYFIIWEGRNSRIATADIYGQLVEGQTGRELGVNDRRLSDMQSYNPRRGEAFQPAVSYNPSLGEYLVVWRGATSSNGSSEREIFGHLINHSDIIRSYNTISPS